MEDDGDQEISDDGVQPTGELESDESDEDEDEEDTSMKDVEAPSYHPASTSAWKAPTTEELGALKEANELFKSSAFKFKVGHSLLY